ncbi:MAG: ABC transporter ATP-binding protein [Candidatus Shapirobacteria bacterium]|jgi:putative ABC transport system ATP-binding protein
MYQRTGQGEAILKVEEVKKNFYIGGQDLPVLKGITLQVNRGDFAIIFGPSGCGKSTLLHAILGMEPPTSGKVWIDGVNLYNMDEDEIVRHRKERIGIVFQQSIWIKSLTVLENVSFPNRLKGMSKEEAESLALETLKSVTLDNWAHHHPSELSSGQQQRVSLARALTIDPLVIVADEPTGNLDTVSGDELMELVSELNTKRGKTVLMVTHDLEYLRYANKLFHIIDGELVEEVDGKGAMELAQKLKSKKGLRTRTTVRDKNFLVSNKEKYVAK